MSRPVGIAAACGRLGILFLLPALGGGVLQARDADDGSPRLRIVTSIPPLYSFTASVAGDAAIVSPLLPPNHGPHGYQLSPGDLKRLRDADLVIINGLGIEDWLQRALRSGMEDSKSRLVEASAGLDRELIRGLPHLRIAGGDTPDRDDKHHSSEAPNPHVWLDPLLARHAVSNIMSALKSRDPNHAADYDRRATAYLGRLATLHQDFQSGLQGVKGQPVVTFHDAFPYLTRRYELKLIGVIEDVPNVEPSARYLAGLLKVIRESKAGLIFTEPQFNPLLAERLAADLKVRVASLDTLETGAASAEFYEEGMRRNLRTLMENLR